MGHSRLRHYITDNRPLFGPAALLEGEDDGLAFVAGAGGGRLIVRDSTTPTNNYNGTITGWLSQTGTSSKWVRRGPDLQLTEVAAGQPALDYHPTHGWGLLSEDAATNLIVQSADFTTTWGNVETTDAADQATAPDGTSTADQIIDTTNSDRHIFYIGPITVTANTRYTHSIYLKNVDRRYVQCLHAASTGSGKLYAYIDLQTGTITDSGTIAGTGTSLDATAIESAGNGWYRVTVSGVVNSTATGCWVQYALSDRATHTGDMASDSPSYAEGSTKSIYAWGAQSEIGPVATSYIPTAGGQATRTRDVIRDKDFDLSNFPYNATDGSWYAKFNVAVPEDSKRVIGSLNSSAALLATSGSAGTAVANWNGAQNLTKTGITNYSTGVAKAAAAGNGSGRSITGSGLTVSTDANAWSDGSTTYIRFGATGATGADIVQGLRLIECLYVPRKMTDAELESITTE